MKLVLITEVFLTTKVVRVQRGRDGADVGRHSIYRTEAESEALCRT